MNLKDFHGVVSKCYCTNPELSMSCKNCFSRGFVAVCLQCSGTGQIKVPVAGAASGDMRSTCDKCGGIGHFGVSKPANWDADHAPVQAETPAEAASEEDDEVDDFKAVTAGAAAADEAVAGIDPMMQALREMQSEPALIELVRPKSIHHATWKRMTREQQAAAIEEASKPAIELVTA